MYRSFLVLWPVTSARVNSLDSDMVNGEEN
jgi:hypothetical protein